MLHPNPKIQKQIASFIRDNLWMKPHISQTEWTNMLAGVIGHMEHREKDPDWERPVIMYGVRKKHKCIKKDEIGVIIDIEPWVNRARTAETHWYTIVYRRKLTDIEWQEVKQGNLLRRYWIWSYFITPRNSVDKILSKIVSIDKRYEVDTDDLIAAFEIYYQRDLQITGITEIKQLTLFDLPKLPKQESTEPKSKNKKQRSYESLLQIKQQQLELFPLDILSPE